jgi:hypothetical protein
VVAALAGVRVAYVQVPGGALPVSLSDAVRELGRRGLVEASIAVGACVDGDVACVSMTSALAFCGAEGFDAVVCSIGPGIVGISTGPHLEIGFADSNGSPIGGGSASTMMSLLQGAYGG